MIFFDEKKLVFVGEGCVTVVLVAVGHRSHSHCFLEVFAEAGLVAEIEIVGDALHRSARND